MAKRPTERQVVLVAGLSGATAVLSAVGVALGSTFSVVPAVLSALGCGLAAGQLVEARRSRRGEGLLPR